MSTSDTPNTTPREGSLVGYDLERIARQLAADAMGLVKDPNGSRLPDDLWRQKLPAAEVYVRRWIAATQVKIDNDFMDELEREFGLEPLTHE